MLKCESVFFSFKCLLMPTASPIEHDRMPSGPGALLLSRPQRSELIPAILNQSGHIIIGVHWSDEQ